MKPQLQLSLTSETQVIVARSNYVTFPLSLFEVRINFGKSWYFINFHLLWTLEVKEAVESCNLALNSFRFSALSGGVWLSQHSEVTLISGEKEIMKHLKSIRFGGNFVSCYWTPPPTTTTTNSYLKIYSVSFSLSPKMLWKQIEHVFCVNGWKTYFFCFFLFQLFFPFSKINTILGLEDY